MATGAEEFQTRFNGAIGCEIIVTAFRKPHELLGFTGKIKEPLAEANGNGPIEIAMHDQKRSRDLRDA